MPTSSLRYTGIPVALSLASYPSTIESLEALTWIQIRRHKVFKKRGNDDEALNITMNLLSNNLEARLQSIYYRPTALSE
jgi:hypothetical protein